MIIVEKVKELGGQFHGGINRHHASFTTKETAQTFKTWAYRDAHVYCEVGEPWLNADDNQWWIGIRF